MSTAMQPATRSCAPQELGELALAAQRRGMSFIAMPAPVVSAASIVGAWPARALVSWTTNELVLVGVGVAHELRGHGADRWRQVIEGARAFAESAGGSAFKPRFLGGAAFAPGAADAAPWRGFGDAWFMLPRWTYVSDGKSAQLVLAVDGEAAAERARWTGELARFRAAFAAPFEAHAQAAVVEQHADTSGWHAQITAITDAIARGACSKIVAARVCEVVLAGEVRAADVLANLDARHAECARLLVRPPDAGTLVAATPERLVRRQGELVMCDALAGTIARVLADGASSGARVLADGFSGPASSGAPESARSASGRARSATGSDALLASAKDRNEHELVVRAIRAALEGADAEVRAPAEPAIRALRHVLHLHTPIRATLRRPRHVLELAARLHPTPAMGGTPTDFAMDWIVAHEPQPRGWYSAPVGWFDLDGNGELAVAIRGGVLVGSRAHLYAGCGIVAGSDPERELAETDVKLQAMLGALR